MNTMQEWLKEFREKRGNKKWGKRTRGIYFLWVNEKVVYVGASNYIQRRIWEHKSRKKHTFTTWSFMEVKNADILMLERYFIQRLKPKYNIRKLQRQHPNKKLLVQL